jgi:sulfate transport system substrate-binding protein
MVLILVTISITISVVACSPTNTVELTLVSYAVTKAAYQKIVDKFAQKWYKETGQNVIINQSYGGSSAQARAVIDGLEADVVALSLGLDIDRIQKAGLIEDGWEKELPNSSIVSQSVVSIVTEDGNPLGIKTWQDLTKSDLKIITANPRSSGVARWNFLALWGAVTTTGGSEQEALDLTKKVYQNVPVLARDARESSDAFFKQGQGNALITYENEAILIGTKGEKVTYLSPDVNISIDNPVAIVDRYVDQHKNREVVTAFVNYLFTPEAQIEFAKVGFRPVDGDVKNQFVTQYPPIKKIFTIADLGGWEKVQTKFFDNGGIFEQVEKNLRNN